MEVVDAEKQKTLVLGDVPSQEVMALGCAHGSQTVETDGSNYGDSIELRPGGRGWGAGEASGRRVSGVQSPENPPYCSLADTACPAVATSSHQAPVLPSPLPLNTVSLADALLLASTPGAGGPCVPAPGLFGISNSRVLKIL